MRLLLVLLVLAPVGCAVSGTPMPPATADAAASQQVPAATDTAASPHTAAAADTGASAHIAAAAGVVAGSYGDGVRERTFHLYLPDAGRGGDAPPLLVMLHGCLQDAASFAAATHMNEHARAAGVIVLYPEQPVTANPQRCWNWFDPVHQERDSGEAAMLAGLTRRVAAEHGVAHDRVYVAGMSAGALMASILAAAYPDVFAALGIHSGGAVPAATSLPEALALMRGEANIDASAAAAVRLMDERLRPLPVIVFHGDADAVVAATNAEQAAMQWRRVHAAARGVDGESLPIVQRSGGEENGRTYDITTYAASADDAPVVELWRVHGLGHAWSGGIAGGSYADPTGPDAAWAMLRFLLRQRRQ